MQNYNFWRFDDHFIGKLLRWTPLGHSLETLYIMLHVISHSLEALYIMLHVYQPFLRGIVYYAPCVSAIP